MRKPADPAALRYEEESKPASCCASEFLVDCGDRLAHVPEKHALAKARVDTGFPTRTCAARNEEERIPFLNGTRFLREARVIPFFVQIKCQLGQSYEVANTLADAEIASEIYSTAGEFDLLVKFYVEDGTDIGHFVNEKVQTIAGIQDTRTIITFKAFRG